MGSLLEVICWVDDNQRFHSKERHTQDGLTIVMEETAAFRISDIDINRRTYSGYNRMHPVLGD